LWVKFSIWTGDTGAEPPPIPIAEFIDHITLAPGLAATPQGEAFKKMLETRYSLTVHFSRLLRDDTHWISKFDTPSVSLLPSPFSLLTPNS
jgi:hypothetical protein